ncbi:hypothetical protein B9Y60_14695 [Stenotrophomonas maltophilia]|nr:hypothetical protein B9Y73_14695 [Stenotrophomonas maltophilia]PJL54732.1 hypothetical protein B9Y60_14695 [Stenotrophomonas maltophilia]
MQSAVQPTLADVQPGGRVRLATVPYDRARDLIGDAYNAGTHGIGYSQQAMELHDAIIPAQPSPGGQGDAWDIAELVRTDLDRQSCPDAYMRIAMESVVKHLAARQPVETQLGYTLSDVHEAYSRGKRDAARQPVGDHLAQDRKMVSQPVGEPVVIAHRVHYLDGVTGKEIAVSPWMDGDGSEFNVIYAAENPTTRWIENAYAAPAQAVDLGPVRDVFRRWHANELNSTDAMLALVEALAFIDSQAVGK